MKFAVKIVLLMFMTFLSTPTVVGILSDDVDTSMIYSMCEEENHKEIKAEIKHLISEVFFPVFTTKTSLMFSNYQLKHDNISKDILSPPPDRV